MSYVTDYEQDYFQWLCDLVQVDTMEKSWKLLAMTLHNIEFYSLVDHDDNRGYDGEELREEYLRMTNYPRYLEINGECSVFEMLIGLARRLEFETCDPFDVKDDGDHVAEWFWELLDNLGLKPFDDEHFYTFGGEDEVKERVFIFLARKYDSDGFGGLFPLEHPKEDQRDVEIWRQMSSYLFEKERA